MHSGSAVAANPVVLNKQLPAASASAKQRIKSESAETWLADKIKRNFYCIGLATFGNGLISNSRASQMVLGGR